MKYSYRRISLYRERSLVISFMLMLAITSAVLEIFFIDYLIARGLENKIQWINVYDSRIGIPILYLPIIGVLVVILSTWAYAVERPYLRKVDIRKLRNSSPILRMFNLSIFFLLVLSIFLFLPCILGSNWSMKELFLKSSEIIPLKVILLGFYKRFIIFMDVAIIWKFVLLQGSACLALAIFSFFLGFRTTARTLKG